MIPELGPGDSGKKGSALWPWTGASICVSCILIYKMGMTSVHRGAAVGYQ